MILGPTSLLLSRIRIPARTRLATFPSEARHQIQRNARLDEQVKAAEADLARLKREYAAIKRLRRRLKNTDQRFP